MEPVPHADVYVADVPHDNVADDHNDEPHDNDDDHHVADDYDYDHDHDDLAAAAGHSGPASETPAGARARIQAAGSRA
jgi:hypothetical protein